MSRHVTLFPLRSSHMTCPYLSGHHMTRPCTCGHSPSTASSPDIILAPRGMDQYPIAHNSRLTTPEASRDRKLSYQASHTRLLAKFNSPPISAASSSSSHVENTMSLPQPPSSASISLSGSGLSLKTAYEPRGCQEVAER